MLCYKSYICIIGQDNNCESVKAEDIIPRTFQVSRLSSMIIVRAYIILLDK